MEKYVGAGLVQALVACGCLFEDPIELLGGQVVVKKVDRVYFLIEFDHFVMAMRSGRFTRAPYPSDHFSAFYVQSRSRFHPYHMPIERLIAVSVVDHNVVAVAIAQIARYAHRTISRCIDGRSLRRRKIQPGMELGGFVDRINAVSESGGDSF